MLQTNGESRLRSFTAHMVRWPAAPWTLREYVSFILECYVRLPGREKKQSLNPQPGPHRVLASLARSRLGVHEVAPELIILKPNGARQPVDRRTSRREPKARRAHSPTANLTFRQVRSGISLDHGADLQQPGVMGGWGGEEKSPLSTPMSGWIRCNGWVSQRLTSYAVLDDSAAPIRIGLACVFFRHIKYLEEEY